MNYQSFVLTVLQLIIITKLSCSAVVTCYFGSWAAYRNAEGKFEIEDIDPQLCSHVIYSFVGLNRDGTIKILDSYLDITLKGYERLNALKSQNPHLKTIIAMGGWNEGSETYSHVVSSPTLRNNLKNSAVEFLKTHGFDGFDIDWEYPAQRGGNPADKENFVSLLKELRAEFDKHGYLLTSAVAAVPSSVDISYDVPALSKYLDYIHVMTYDLHGSWDGKTGENAPLYPSSHDISPLQQTLNVNVSIHGWIERGAAPEKLIMGMPIYGRTFMLASANNHGIGDTTWGPGNPGPYTQSAGIFGYNEICTYASNGEWSVVWNEEQKVPYAYKGNQWVGYDDPKSIKIKVDFAKDLNLAGVMVWSLDTDDFKGLCGAKYPILTTINQAYGHVTYKSSLTFTDDNTV